MPKYILLIYGDQERWADLGSDDIAPLTAEYGAYTQAMVDAGSFVAGDPLEGIETAKTVAKGGVVTDGPFADVTEHLGGYYVVDVDSLEEAVELAARVPGVDRGLDRVEVRPIRPFILEGS